MSRADHHYRLDTLDQIKALPVASLAADDCALLLWCTGPHIAIGSHVEVIRAWGFRPSTMAFVWVKENKTDGRIRTRGQGCWTTANAEICFIATKGSPLRLAFDVHQVVIRACRRAQRETRRGAPPHRAAVPRSLPRTLRAQAGPRLDGLGQSNSARPLRRRIERLLDHHALGR